MRSKAGFKIDVSINGKCVVFFVIFVGPLYPCVFKLSQNKSVETATYVPVKMKI